MLPALVLPVSPALAHASDRGHVLLLPTGHYLAGGALAVAASFVVLVLLPPPRQPASFDRFADGRGDAAGGGIRLALSLLSFLIFATLVATGFFGSRDPLSNPLPLVVWTLLWVGLTLVQGLVGDVWRWIDPWYGPWRLALAVVGRAPGDAAPFSLPARAGSWPAVALLAAFAWFELVYPAPDDPYRLALAAGGYWLFAFAAMLAFGHRQWSERGEFLSLFFAMIGRLGVVSNGGRLRLPGAGLAAAPPLSISGSVFLLAALASVSFDGLSKTFFWFGLNGINPLEYPGRTALAGINTAGLALAAAVLAGGFLAAVAAGERLAQSRLPLSISAGTLVWSIVPIALAYHLSHYLAVLLVNGQYALVALSDPFALGWNLFGTAYLAVGAGIASGSSAAWAIWNVQAAAIVGGHVLAVVAAHRLAFRLHAEPRAAMLCQLPLTVLMVLYTVFGLWLLSTPTAG